MELVGMPMREAKTAVVPPALPAEEVVRLHQSARRSEVAWRRLAFVADAKKYGIYFPFLARLGFHPVLRRVPICVKMKLWRLLSVLAAVCWN